MVYSEFSIDNILERMKKQKSARQITLSNQRGKKSAMQKSARQAKISEAKISGTMGRTRSPGGKLHYINGVIVWVARYISIHILQFRNYIFDLRCNFPLAFPIVGDPDQPPSLNASRIKKLSCMNVFAYMWFEVRSGDGHNCTNNAHCRILRKLQ